jgi:hypothetical protein
MTDTLLNSRQSVELFIDIERAPSRLWTCIGVQAKRSAVGRSFLYYRNYQKKTFHIYSSEQLNKTYSN